MFKYEYLTAFKLKGYWLRTRHLDVSDETDGTDKADKFISAN